jgi:hypothetical protein
MRMKSFDVWCGLLNYRSTFPLNYSRAESFEYLVTAYNKRLSGCLLFGSFVLRHKDWIWSVVLRVRTPVAVSLCCSEKISCVLVAWNVVVQMATMWCRKKSYCGGRSTNSDKYQLSLTFVWPCIVTNFLIINQLDALISQNIIFGRKLYIFRIVPLSIIRSLSLYTQHW